MKKAGKAAVIIAASIVTITANSALASSFIYQGGKKTHDATIEAAAIKKAAEKIGDMRGTLEGAREEFIFNPEKQGDEQSSRLGFPIIMDAAATSSPNADVVPIL